MLAYFPVSFQTVYWHRSKGFLLLLPLFIAVLARGPKSRESVLAFYFVTGQTSWTFAADLVTIITSQWKDDRDGTGMSSQYISLFTFSLKKKSTFFLEFICPSDDWNRRVRWPCRSLNGGDSWICSHWKQKKTHGWCPFFMSSSSSMFNARNVNSLSSGGSAARASTVSNFLLLCITNGTFFFSTYSFFF